MAGAGEDLVDRFALAPERASVPGRARTRDQWEEWNALWPIAWQKPNSHLAIPLEAPSAEDVTEMKRWMRSCIDAAREGGATNAAILVDPPSLGDGHRAGFRRDAKVEVRRS